MRLFQVDAFASRLFSGNPAAVVILNAFLKDAVLQSIAMENNLAETAFLVRRNADYDLRWFTPKVEVPLCGHATLASAAVVMERLEPRRKQVTFHTLSGALAVQRAGNKYLLDFPARFSEPTERPGDLTKALHVEPLEVVVNEFNYLAVLADEDQLRVLAPDIERSSDWTVPV